MRQRIRLRRFYEFIEYDTRCNMSGSMKNNVEMLLSALVGTDFYLTEAQELDLRRYQHVQVNIGKMTFRLDERYFILENGADMHYRSKVSDRDDYRFNHFPTSSSNTFKPVEKTEAETIREQVLSFIRDEQYPVLNSKL